MKFILTFKTPDVEDQLEPEELKKVQSMLDKYVEYGEYLYVEFDTDKKTCTVLSV